MPVTRSEEYYFPRGDLVIQIEDTLFRVYRGFLELHSGFFSDMFSAPSSDPQEGTSDEHPLQLPRDLCSAESFTVICKLIYPKLTDVFPPILLNDFAKWDLVLETTEALQMARVRNYILARLGDDEADITIEPAKLLRWAMRSEVPLETLKLKCIYVLTYRRRPLSEVEMSVIGYKASAQVARARERIRSLFSNSTFTQSLVSQIPIPVPCSSSAACQRNIYSHFVYRLLKDELKGDSENEQDNSNIFQISCNPGCAMHSCYSQSALDAVGPALREAKLDEEVRRGVLGVPPS